MSADTKPSLNAPHGQLRTTRRRLLAGAGAVAAAAAAAPLAVARQQQPTSKKSGPAKVAVMTDSHKIGDDHRKMLQDTTKIEIGLGEADLTRVYGMYAAGNP